jgi:hypothetical protein
LIEPELDKIRTRAFGHLSSRARLNRCDCSASANLTVPRLFRLSRTHFELYQQVLTVVSKDTAPNHWAMLCAELGHTLVAALPLLSEHDRKKMAKDAIAAFEAARSYFLAGGLGQDLERLGPALQAAIALSWRTKETVVHER